MKDYLISCWYTVYCQGSEEAFGYFLVRARDYQEALNKLRNKLEDPRDFHNCTIE